MSRRLILGFLLILPLAAFSGILGNGFVNFDDQDFVTENVIVREGLSASSLRWAFTRTLHGHWMPVTLMSHLADVELYGLNPRGHHLTSLLLHALNSVLLFAALSRLTGDDTRSALAAALFAVHPLQAESVAWVSQRRNLLCGLFFILTLWSYADRSPRHSARGALRTGLFLALALMSKPTVVFLPFLLLLLDYWPLNRAREIPSRRLFMEKIPFLALAAGTGAISLAFSPHQSFERVPLDLRVMNAAASCWRYVFKFVWPADLAVYYPYPDPKLLSLWAAPAVLSLLFLTAAAAVALKRRSPIGAGWLWFLGLLSPVLGLIQVGGQSMADRYMYLPLIGLAIASVWGGSSLAARFPRSAATGAVAAIAMLMTVSGLQTRHWQDGTALFRRASTVTKDNALAHQMLGLALLERGELKEAEAQLRRSLELQEGKASAEALGQLGFALAIQGRREEAMESLSQSLRLDPAGAESRHNLSLLLSVLRDPSVVTPEKNPADEKKQHRR